METDRDIPITGRLELDRRFGIDVAFTFIAENFGCALLQEGAIIAGFWTCTGKINARKNPIFRQLFYGFFFTGALDVESACSASSRITPFSSSAYVRSESNSRSTSIRF